MALDTAQVDALITRVFPESRKLGWEILSVGEGKATVHLPLEERHMRPGPTVSGPTLMSLADLAMYCAVLAAIGPKPLAVTTNLNINFMRGCHSGTLVADATLLKLGKRLAVGEVAIHPEGSAEAVAHATLTYSLPPA
jgi:uncharacterized protein (TIGR00369 family)